MKSNDWKGRLLHFLAVAVRAYVDESKAGPEERDEARRLLQKLESAKTRNPAKR